MNETSLEVSEDGKDVIWKFSKPTEHLALDPENARQIAEATAKAAYTCKYGLPADSNKSLISEQVRMRLITRCTHVIRSLSEKQKLPGFIASEIVDVILREVS